MVAAVLEQIAADEWRHAQLGWRSLAWILEQVDPEQCRFALFVLEAATGSLGASALITPIEPIEDDRHLRQHGILDAALRQQLRRAGIDSVILPCVAALRERLGRRSSEFQYT